MIVCKFYIEYLEHDGWLYISEELARECAEKSMEDNEASEQVQLGNDLEMEWREDMMNALPTRENIERGTKPAQIPSGEHRLYIRYGQGVWEDTAYLVGPVEVFEEVNF